MATRRRQRFGFLVLFSFALVAQGCDPTVHTNRGGNLVADSALDAIDSRDDAASTSQMDAAPMPAMDSSVPDAQQSEPDASMPQELARVTNVNTSLTLRSGPSTSHDIITSMPKDCLVTLLGETSGEWLKVDYRGMVGWAHGMYLEPVPAGTADCGA